CDAADLGSVHRHVDDDVQPPDDFPELDLEEPGDPAPVDAVMPGEMREVDRERLPVGIAVVVATRVAAMTARRGLGIGLRFCACVGLGGRVIRLWYDRGPCSICGCVLCGSGTRCGRCRRGIFSPRGEAGSGE